MPLSIQEGLQRLGHQVRNVSGYPVVQAVARNVDGTLTGKSPGRVACFIAALVSRILALLVKVLFAIKSDQHYFGNSCI